MLNWKWILGIFCALGLATTIPESPARAGDGRAIAAGIIGTVGGAIIMNQMMQNRQGYYQRTVRRKAAHSKGEPSKEAANAKDPFAGEKAPAGYARPVSNSSK